MRALILVLLLNFTGMAGNALARQDPAPVKRAVENFLRIQIKGLPGQASFSVGEIDAGNQLAPCGHLDVAMAPGARVWGRTQVAVRCEGENSWTMYVPVQVKVSGHYLVTARPLAQGTLIGDADVIRQPGELTELPTGILTDLAQATGRTLIVSLPAGRPLRSDVLRQAMVVQQNQSVKVVSQGQGFSVANEGRALGNAAEGQVVQVRLANGQVVSGVARAGGTVEVKY